MKGKNMNKNLAKYGQNCWKKNNRGNRQSSAILWGKSDYTHIFIICELISKYTGHLLHMAFWQEFFCVIRAPMKVFSANASITHINCLGMNFPITHTSLTQKNCFWITVLSQIVTYRQLILSELIYKKLPIPLPILFYFEFIKVTVADGPVSVLPPPSQNCPKVTDS